MKRAFLTLVTAAAMILAFGCAQVDYPCITDVSQTGDGSVEFVSTSGKAHIEEFSQSALILTDGTTVEIVNFLDQSTASGTVVSDLYNYEYRTPSADFNFHDDQFCSPDWTGCSAATNTDNAFCGANGKGGLTIASGPCSDGLFLLFGDSIRDSECGKSAITDPLAQLGGLTLVEAINLIANNSTAVEIDGVSWRQMTLHPNLTFSYDNGGGWPGRAEGIDQEVRVQVHGHQNPSSSSLRRRTSSAGSLS